MANKYDLKTWVKRSLVAGASARCIGSDAVAAGKTRFLTYIRVTRAQVTATAMGSLVCGIASVAASSPTAGSALDTSVLKLNFNFPGWGAGSYVTIDDAFVVQEIQGSIEHPIISVAGESYMSVATPTVAGSVCDIFAEYYDE